MPILRAHGRRRSRRTSSPTGSARRRCSSTGRGSAPSSSGPSPAIVGATKSEQLVDEVALEERGRERRPALEQQRLHAFRAEPPSSSSSGPEQQLELGAVGQRAAAEGEPPRLARGVDVARVQPRVVGADGAHADGDRVGRPRAARGRAGGSPRPVTQREPGHGHAAVERDRELERHERPAGRDPGAPRLVLRARLERVGVLDLDARCARAARARRPPRGSGRASRRRPSPLPPRARPRCTAASCRGGRTAPSSRRASRPRARSPAASSATTSACGPPLRSCQPSPTTSPPATTTAPTTGFGWVVPRPRSASSSARVAD